MSLIAKMDAHIARLGGLVVSCQPVPDSPLDKPEIVAAMALAAQQAGAVALRIEGINNLRAVRQVVTLPIIGIIKRDLTDSPVRITPIWRMSMRWHRRGRILSPLTVRIVLARLRCVSCWRDPSPRAGGDGRLFLRAGWSDCQQAGAELIGTTLSGYTMSIRLWRRIWRW
jgi:N-acylglucosamine-6-phosphate 2-epimerase